MLPAADVPPGEGDEWRSSVLDPAIAHALTQDLPPAIFRRILETFEADVARLTAQLVAAAAMLDADGFRRAAHSLAGAAASVGAVLLEQSARQAMAPTAEPDRGVAARIQAQGAMAVQALAALATRQSEGSEAWPAAASGPGSLGAS